MKSTTGQFSLEIMVHGRLISEYLHHGEVFAEGKKGSEYILRVRNNTGRRAVAVVSVDGLSVMDGKVASKNGSGYVVDSYGFVDIPGWRLDSDAVAKFLFGSLPEAYATKMGKPTNIGVIGVVFFHEKKREHEMCHALYSMSGTMRGGGTLGGNSSSEKGIGTGFGRRQEHRVETVSFDREISPVAQITIRYDDADGLRARGINVTAPHMQSDRVVAADPFPADTGCKVPSGWRG